MIWGVILSMPVLCVKNIILIDNCVKKIKKISFWILQKLVAKKMKSSKDSSCLLESIMGCLYFIAVFKSWLANSHISPKKGESHSKTQGANSIWNNQIKKKLSIRNRKISVGNSPHLPHKSPSSKKTSQITKGPVDAKTPIYKVHKYSLTCHRIYLQHLILQDYLS